MADAVFAEEGKPGYLAVYQANLGDGKSLSLQFNVAQGATEQDWAAMLDVLSNVADRQIARASLPREINVLAVKEATAANIERDVEKLQKVIADAENARDPERRNQAPVAQHVANLGAQKDALLRVHQEIANQKKLIAELEKKAA